MHHQEQDNLSLMLHAAAVSMMRLDDALRIRAIEILHRWDRSCDHHFKPLRDEWLRILQESDWDAALDTTERGNQIRQASPCACVLPNEKRLAIIRSKKSGGEKGAMKSLDEALQKFDAEKRSSETIERAP